MSCLPITISVVTTAFALAVTSLARAEPEGLILPTRELIGLADLMMTPKPGLLWPRWRYLSFAAALPEDIDKRKAAVRFALAALNRTAATEAQYLAQVTPLLWGVDTATLGWPDSVWESYGRTEHYYEEAGSETLKLFFKLKAGTERPILRADEFIDGCFAPERYAAALAIPQTKEDFLNTFLGPRGAAGADRAFGIISEKLTVANFPGKVARFKPADRPAVWMRVLYGDDRGLNEQRLHPADIDGEHTEFSWELPNGLGAYTTYDATGRLALTVSTKLSKDKQGHSVRLGISCIECHTAGIRGLENADDPDKLLLLNINAAEWNKERLMFLAGEDQKRWTNSLAAINGLSPSRNADARRNIIDDFGHDLTPGEAARELGLSDWPDDKPTPRKNFGDAVALSAAMKVNKLYLEAARQRMLASGQIKSP
jgi:hypothetical protein